MKIIPHLHEVEFMPESRSDVKLIRQLALVLRESDSVRARTIKDVRETLPSLVISEIEGRESLARISVTH
ncbi:MAG TPA: hypothetical protein VG345_16560 [Bryobacteraceae bacterium]|jgi:hypothetical protein|nr:hypothetical protein [Bryobacteraceae bacterium]